MTAEAPLRREPSAPGGADELRELANNYYYEEENAMSTRRLQEIEAVAGILLANGLLGDDNAIFEANEIGWGFEVRWHDQWYLNENDYTRVRECVLEPSELKQAIAQAMEWQADPDSRLPD